MIEPVKGSMRAEILAAALQVFLDKGIDGASIEDVRNLCGASVGNIYHHFTGKRGLAGHVYLAALTAYQSAFTTALMSCSEPQEGVREVVRTHLTWCLDSSPDHARFLLLHADTVRGPVLDELRTLNRDFYSTVIMWWKKHADSGELRVLPTDLLYAIWLGPSQELCRIQLIGDSASGTESVTDHIAVLGDAAWSALRTPQIEAGC